MAGEGGVAFDLEQHPFLDFNPQDNRGCENQQEGAPGDPVEEVGGRAGVRVPSVWRSMRAMRNSTTIQSTYAPTKTRSGAMACPARAPIPWWV